jgi:hypothetical protein
MNTLLSAFVIGLMLMGAGLAAQTPAAPATQGRQAVAPPPPPPAPRPPTAPASRTNTNIRVDVTVIDEGGSQPLRKTVSVTSVDGLRASSRSVSGFGGTETNLHVDATPTLDRNGKIQVRVAVFYRPNPFASPGGEGNRPNAASVNFDFPIVLDDGKRVVASQTTDPTSDRRVTIEVMATILK